MWRSKSYDAAALSMLMASPSTRSSRRTDGGHHTSLNPHLSSHLASNSTPTSNSPNTTLRSATANAHNTRRTTPQTLPNTSSRRKRLRDDEIDDLPSKKPKIHIASSASPELKLKEKALMQGRKRGLGIGVVTALESASAVVDATSAACEEPVTVIARSNNIITKAGITNLDFTAPTRLKATARTQPGSQQSAAAVARLREKPSTVQLKVEPSKPVKVPAPTKHADKVVAGIKHELDKLKPKEEYAKADEKRKLRSQEGTRFKSELSLYFPDYDIVIGNEVEETHFLNFDTPIIITDSNVPALSKSQPDSPAKTTPAKRLSIKLKVPPKIPARSFPDALFHNLHQAQKVDLSILGQQVNGHVKEDPLLDEYYKGHDKSERLERNIRNGEKNKAMHERDQVARLMEALQGHDWLKVMGVSGITESKKKEYEPAREHFVRGCQGILEKFRQWRDEEKRRKLERDQQLAEVEEEEDEEEAEEEDDEGNESDGDPPDYSDVDHAAAQQLHEEAIARSAGHSAREKRNRVVAIEPAIQVLEREFKSFYSKPHLREAALGKHRRSGRTTSAWGQPIPEVGEEDFNLPVEFQDKDVIEANARKRRRERRVSKE